MPSKLQAFSEYVEVPVIEVVVGEGGAALVLWDESARALPGAWSGGVPSGSPRVWTAPRPLTDEPEDVYELKVFRSGTRVLSYWGNGFLFRAIDADLSNGTWGPPAQFAMSCYHTRPFIRPEAAGFQMLWANPPGSNCEDSSQLVISGCSTRRAA